MQMNKSLQTRRIGHALSKRGIETDLVDLDAEIDSSLTLEENFNAILSSYGSFAPKRIEAQPTRSVNKMDNFFRAQEIQERRSPRSISMDAGLRAQKTFEMGELSNKNFRKWKKKPNRFDIAGIDSKGGF